MARMSNAHVGGLRCSWLRRRSRRTTCSENCRLQGLTIHDSVSLRILCPRRDACMYAMIWTAMRYVKHQFWRLRLRDAHAQKHHPVACPQMSASLEISGISTILQRRCGWIWIHMYYVQDDSLWWSNEKIHIKFGRYNVITYFVAHTSGARDLT